MVWGFSLFKDNIYTRSERHTSVTTSCVTASSCAQPVSGVGCGDGSLWPAGEQGPGRLAPRLPWAACENPAKATGNYYFSFPSV